MNRACRPLALTSSAAALVAVALAAACGGGQSTLDKSKLPEGSRSSTIEHEACNESGHRVENVDVHADGKADIRRVYDGDHEVCRISDLNRDGKPDMFEYYDKSGQLRRREADYDDNGVINAIEIYEGGKLVRAELDTTNHGRIDTWDTFDPSTGKRTRRERDVSGDGKVDQWWTFEGDKITIQMDRNGDGKPDADSTVVLGGSGSASASGPADGGAPKAPEPAAAPPPAEPSPTTGDAGVGPPKRGGAKR